MERDTYTEFHFISEDPEHTEMDVDQLVIDHIEVDIAGGPLEDSGLILTKTGEFSYMLVPESEKN